jgi:hypothetical protein
MNTHPSDSGEVAVSRRSVNHNHVDCSPNFVFIEIRFNLDEASDVSGVFLKATIDIRQKHLNNVETLSPLPLEESRLRVRRRVWRG